MIWRAIHRSLLITRSSFSGTVDLSAGLAAFADDDLRARLGGPGIGLDPAQVKDATGVDLDKLVSLQVSVDLPGSLTSSSPPAGAHGGATWRPQLGETLVLAASARRYNTTVIAYLAIGLVAALGALILARRRRRPSA